MNILLECGLRAHSGYTYPRNYWVYIGSAMKNTTSKNPTKGKFAVYDQSTLANFCRTRIFVRGRASLFFNFEFLALLRRSAKCCLHTNDDPLSVRYRCWRWQLNFRRPYRTFFAANCDEGMQYHVIGRSYCWCSINPQGEDTVIQDQGTRNSGLYRYCFEINISEAFRNTLGSFLLLLHKLAHCSSPAVESYPPPCLWCKYCRNSILPWPSHSVWNYPFLFLSPTACCFPHSDSSFSNHSLLQISWG